MLEKLCSRARHTYSTFCSNTTSGGSQKIPLLTLPDDIHDLSAFGGTKGGVIKSPASSPPKGDPPSPESSLSAVSGDGPATSAQPGPIQQQSQYGMPYQRAADFSPSLFVPQEQSMLPSYESGYSVSSERAEFPSPSQGCAQQQNPLVLPPTDDETLEFDLEALGLTQFPQQPMQYSLYPQLDQFRDIFMSEDTSVQPPQIPHDDLYWKFVDDLGIQRI